MLARSARGLYWVGRYLERAQHGCRLLSEQLGALEDRPVAEIELNWRRVYAALGRAPLGGDLASGLTDDAFMLADAYTLVGDLAFEPDNPDAIRNCLASARENARQVRNTLDRELWGCLNLAFLGIRDVGVEDVWKDRPVDFVRSAEDAVRSFWGVADSAMYRDESWHFLRLGRYVERTQLLAALIDAQLAVFPSREHFSESDWLSLLRVCGANGAYGRLFSLKVRPPLVINFLVTDPYLPRSVRFGLRMIIDALDVVSLGEPLAVEAGRRAGRTGARIDFDWPNLDLGDRSAARAMLHGIRESCGLLHDDIRAAYFAYEIEDTPGG